VRCPFCKNEQTRVIDTRESGGGNAIRRRRACSACSRRFTTYERLEEAVLKVVKKDGRREGFQPEKIKSCLVRSCEKLPVSQDQIEEMVDAIEREVREVHDREVPSKFMGELIMMRLRQLNTVAYVRYASIYREFREPLDFLEELRPLLPDDAR
jgi:transcriptional repressor NrdR